VLVRRTLSKSAELVPRRMADRNVRVHLRPGEGRGFVKRTLAWIRFAEQNGFAALVLVIDQDGCREREEELETAQADSHVTLPRALGVAIRTFDAWMLADEVALSRALACEIPRQKDPESLRDPKRVCRNLLDESGGPMSQADLYAAIADFADLDLVAQRCPRGFAPLRERIRRL
jgi:hypothetical protein